MSSYTISLSERNSGEIIWNYELDNIELLAGMLAAGVGIIYDLNYDIVVSNPEKECPRLYNECGDVCIPDSGICNLLTKSSEFSPQILTNKKDEYILDSDTDVSSFRIVSEIPEDKIVSNMKIVSDDGYYGLWIRGTNKYFYSLYNFRTSRFFQGIISMCDAFQVDFRNYIYGLPFDKYGNQYALGDYVMTYSQMSEDAPDLDDIEQEEMDEYNTPEPLHRTDDIIII